MATENQPGDLATDSTETVDQEANGGPAGETQQEDTNSSTQAQEDGDTSISDEKEKDPAKQALLSDLYKERQNRKALQAQVEELNKSLATNSEAVEQLTVVQRKYDRLEEFLSKAGGPLGKALDSRSFTAKLFESDEDIGDLVTAWNRDNPSPTHVALGSGSASTHNKPSMNDLLRQASSS